MDNSETDVAEAWKQLGQWLRIHREGAALMTRASVADRGGPSVSTQQQLEDGGRRTRGEWVLPSPDEKTWGRLCAAVDLHPEELRHAGAKLGLWEHEEFPLAAVVRHMEATLNSSRDDVLQPTPRSGTAFDHARSRFDDLLDELAALTEALSIPDLERLVDLASTLAFRAGEAQVENYLLDAAKDGISPERALRLLSHSEDDEEPEDHARPDLQAAKDEAKPVGEPRLTKGPPVSSYDPSED